MKRLFSYVTVALLITMVGCSLVSSDEDPAPKRQISATEQAVVDSDNRFGLRLFHALSEAEQAENVFISPLSVSMALGMTLNGAKGETYDEMVEVLEKQGLSETEVNQAYRSLIDFLTTLDPEVALEIANSIWYREGFPVLPAFLDVNRSYFDAEVEALDFRRSDAPDRINGWVEEKTHGKIDQIIDEIDEAVVMYLINAVYFKGTWVYEFDPEETRDATFSNADGSVTTVPMMTQQATLPYVESDLFAAVDLPYGDSLFSMTVLLPKPGVDINTLAGLLDETRWAAWTGAFEGEDVVLSLPRFTVEYRESLVDVLKSLGIEAAFASNAADFSRINGTGDLWISDVIHKTFVEVNEEGTEAAAVTAVVIETTSVGGGPKTFRVDRPFVFAIRERESGSILFIGKVLGL